jgi:PBP1b-binding outer membrane lipoprotein LpoB
MKTLTLFIILSALFLSGCGEPELIYIDPTYNKIIPVDKIPEIEITVAEDGGATPESTAKMVGALRAHRIKEEYYDNTIYEWNQLADKKNKKAKEHNTEVLKKQRRFFDFLGV